ncbi:MAG: permease [Planctomycetota bacterium]
MTWKSEWKPLALIAAGLAIALLIPVGWARFDAAVMEALYLVQWYAREHVLLCLVPAFFIAGGIGVFVQNGSVMRYLGGQAPRLVAYGVASVAGNVLAVCSCTVLPLFAGIYRAGAGLGPATTFLYSGPAINVLALILTFSVLGPRLGLARAIGAVGFSIVIGALMAFIFRREEVERATMAALPQTQDPDAPPRWQFGLFFLAMVAILVFANWAGAADGSGGAWAWIFRYKWWLTGAAALVFGVMLVKVLRVRWWEVAIVGAGTTGLGIAFPSIPTIAFSFAVVGLVTMTAPRRDTPAGDWLETSWGYAKQILPLLLAGVLLAGFLLGRPGHEGLVPSEWVASVVGGNSLAANFFASVVGALMYFATLTEIPILQGLLGAGMGEGPALALLLSGPALSLPSLLVIRSVLGTRKTLVYAGLVVVLSTLAGWCYGMMI